MKLDPEAFRVKPGEKFICTFRRKSSGNVPGAHKGEFCFLFTPAMGLEK